MYLGGLGLEMDPKGYKMVPKLTFWSIWTALGPKFIEIVPKLLIWNIWAALGPK